jgi:hypothetical protein
MLVSSYTPWPYNQLLERPAKLMLFFRSSLMPAAAQQHRYLDVTE